MIRRLSLAVLLGLVLASCHPVDGVENSTEAKGATVDPARFDAFYLWPGVRPAANLHAHTLYLLDGEIRRTGPPHLHRLRMGIPRLPGKAVWLVVRADRLHWSKAAYADILADLQRWRDAGNDVVGLQVDFDAATRGIGGYAAFLSELRARLPRQWKLSVTGLMDWSAHGDPQALAKLAHVIDDVVVQTYQGRDTIPGYDAYFRRMDGFPIPFHVALVEGGQWRAPPSLARHPLFRGYVVFLLNRKR